MIMHKILSILFISSIAIGSVQAATTKQQAQYNAEATQKLQQKINFMEDRIELLTPEFLTTINALIDQGADPNIGHTLVFGGEKIFSPLLDELVTGPGLVERYKNLDVALMERVTKNALEHGADPNAQDYRGGYFGKSVLGQAIKRGSPAQVQMLLDYGATLSGIQTRRGDTPEIVLERDIMIGKEALQREKDPSAHLRTQNDIVRMEQILDILKTAAQKK